MTSVFSKARISARTWMGIGIFLLLLPSVWAQAEVIELNPSQSMIITGKGPGQDGAINPYIDKASIAMVENIGRNPFEVRIQTSGKILEIRKVSPGKTEEFSLQKGVELYLDSELPGRAKVNFKPSEPD